ncbi:MAG TPA: hypothetical protein EYG69_02815 [Campylobacterales bacterium]|nr:hypothetical protein [Campylobacterales bacterium]
MQTLTIAKILEGQGYFIEALKIYKNLLEEEPENKELQQYIKKYKNKNIKVLEFFTRMKKDDDYIKLERWLSKWN